MAKASHFEELRIIYHDVLRNSFLNNNIDDVNKTYESNKVLDVDQKSAIDQVFRDILLELIEDETTNKVDILQNYVTFCIESCRKDMTTPTMPVVLLGDIFDALTLDKCEEMFAFVEEGVQIWKESLFFSSCKNNLLRMCNDLLRRLSRSQNTVFCGRILLFLAKFFPFSERSGLNIVSEFNLDNVTEFGGDSSNNLRDMLAETENTEDEKPVKIDYNLYCKFWALQDFFRDPTQCYEKIQWKKFTHNANHVLLAFSSFKLDEIQSKRIKLDSSDSSHISESMDDEETHYFAKYLTNQKLLELQLSDGNFRRYVLVQFLILFQYLNSTVKFKSEKCDLKPEQIDWVNGMTDMVYGLLSETPPDGRAFARCIRHILAREEHWNTWKNDGCQEFKKPLTISDNTDESVEKKRSKSKREKPLLGDLIKDAASSNKFIMGNPELTKLWNLCPDNLEACKVKERNFLPSLETYFAEAIEQIDPAAMVEEKYKKVNDGNFGWRALRLLARCSPHFFTLSNNPINKLPEYLEIMIRKIAKDKHERTNQELLDGDTQNEGEMEDELLKDTEGDDQNGESEEKFQRESDSEIEHSKQHSIISQEQLDMVSIKIDDNWEKVAVKLGFQLSEIKFFQNEQPSDPLRCRNMLQIWFEEEDSNKGILAYILGCLQLNEAAECLK